MAPAANISSSKYYICYDSWAHMSGLKTLVHAPLSYKRGGMHLTKGALLDQAWADSERSSFHSNPTHSGVGYYAPAARTTLNPLEFMCLVIA
jgi:hypothetical protein